ncbi:hypothetical protein RRG08_051100 [Elysia crispata]|uniref:Uncharacterized protein n=1 Tax=Elysia crispata TaxID=231223 RepID=A0AAE1DYT5_9GAST|nr:hypothetical protein RRG08_051100 [Elysia crispata]
MRSVEKYDDLPRYRNISTRANSSDTMSPFLLMLVVAPVLIKNIHCQVPVPQVYDCLVGSTNCQTAGSVVYSGNTVICCKSGDSMSSMSFSNWGTQAHYTCKCSPGGLAMINGRPMTPAEKKKFVQDMNKWSTDFQRNMNSWSSNLQASLSNMFNGWHSVEDEYPLVSRVQQVFTRTHLPHIN